MKVVLFLRVVDSFLKDTAATQEIHFGVSTSLIKDE